MQKISFECALFYISRDACAQCAISARKTNMEGGGRRMRAREQAKESQKRRDGMRMEAVDQPRSIQSELKTRC